MNAFKQIKEQGGSDEELLDLLQEKLHEEKLWILRQSSVIPGLFRKRIKKLRDLVQDYNSLSEALIEVSESSDLEIYNIDVEERDLIVFLSNYDQKMNQFRLYFMNSTGVNDMINSLQSMIAFEETYYDLLESNFDLDDLDLQDIPPNEKLEAFKMIGLLNHKDPLKDPDFKKELLRVKRILRVYRKSR